MTRTVLLGVLALVALLPACGGTGGRVEVSGEVTVNGQPLEEGSLTLVPLEQAAGSSAGAKIVGGKYLIPAAQGPLPGKYRVEIIAVRKTGEKIVDDMREPPNNLVDKIEQFLPAQFNAQSELRADIQLGANRNVNFALTLPSAP